MILTRGGPGRSVFPFPLIPEINMSIDHATPVRRIVFFYLVPVHVTVEGDIVCDVVVIDETPVRDPGLIEGDAEHLAAAILAANDGQAWPSWRFGY